MEKLFQIQDVPHITHHFWSTRDELSIKEGILLKGNGICITPELYERTLYVLHDSHQSIKKMTHLARPHVYLPGSDAEILDNIRYCTICTRFKVTQAVQPMLPRDIPNRPWQKLAAD